MRTVLILLTIFINILNANNKILVYKNLKIYWQPVKLENETEAIVSGIVIGKKNRYGMGRWSFSCISLQYYPVFTNAQDYLYRRNNGILQIDIITPLYNTQIYCWQSFGFSGDLYLSFNDVLKIAHEGINLYWQETKGSSLLRNLNYFSFNRGGI